MTYCSNCGLIQLFSWSGDWWRTKQNFVEHSFGCKPTKCLGTNRPISQIPQCTYGALQDMEQVCCGICEFAQLQLYITHNAIDGFIVQSYISVCYLTHWGRDEMNNISQTTFSNVFSSMKMFEFRLKFHWSLFPRVQLTIFQHWFR